MRRLNSIVLGLFFCSGACALIYEVLWSKYLALMFGSTIYAQTIVLAVFMGGLALGNRIFGRRAALLRSPLAAYGYLEVTIALYAFFFDNIYRAADSLFVQVGSRLLEKTALLMAWKASLSVLLLLGPTILMGGTLPLLAGWLDRQQDDPNRRSARFYSVNSLGAVLGSFLAGFLLVRELGMVAGLQATALVNLLCGLTAAGLGKKEAGRGVPPRREPSDGLQTPRPSEDSVAPPAAMGSSLLPLCILVALSGGVSMGLEVLASRCVAMIVGASLQAFAIVLISFILGIGIGSAVVAGRRKPWAESAPLWLMLSAALAIGLFVLNIEACAFLYVAGRAGLAPTPVGFLYHQLFVGLISIVVLGCPAALLGAILPLCIRTAAKSEAGLASQVGRLLTWNTLGAVLGVLITGFVLMPALGLRGALATLALFITGVALVLALRKREVAVLASAGALAVALLWVGFSGGSNWQQVLGTGVFRLRLHDPTRASFHELTGALDIKFYEDGPDATVSVNRIRSGASDLALRINGKPDASSHGDLSTQYLLAHLPMLARPQSKEVFLFGLGSGITAGAVLTHPVDRVTIAENCRPIIRASALFNEWNRHVLDDRRVRLFDEDARTVLKLDSTAYDLIISEPSNPWVAGVGSVFSREFYEIARSRLKEGGVMAQWFHIYEMHDEIVFLVLRTFHTVFPNMEIWESDNGDIILLGSKQPWVSTPDSFRAVFERPAPRADLEQIGLKSPEMVFLRQLASQRTAFAIPGEGPTQSDFFPILETSAPMAFFMGQSAGDLFRFDERTEQFALAPEAKRAALAGLSNEAFGSIFAEFKTGNTELLGYAHWRKGHGPTDAYDLKPVLGRLPASYPLHPEKPEGMSPEASRLLDCQITLLATPDHWREAVATIESTLVARVAADAGSLDWTPGPYAALAARTRMANGDLGGAASTINLGLRLAPQDQQLAYLRTLLHL